MPDEAMAYRAIDDSMVDRQIDEGDIVLLEKRSYARRGEITLVLAKGKDMILGLFHQMGGETEIRPANADRHARVFSADEVEVQGVMRGLVRPIPSIAE